MGLSRHWKCNRKLVVAAVGKWESRGGCGIPKRSGFSRAVGLLAALSLGCRFLRRLRTQAAIRQARDALQLALDAPAHLKRVQAFSQLLELRHFLRIRLRALPHPLERRARRAVH